ncbi:MAG TPA: PQQ-binding-like beta-propeller repeat protein [Planctomycetota bacterium]|nr:PQQ-binding-like beta-propeller repeat protein [Planctomycetota bacterium]
MKSSLWLCVALAGLGVLAGMGAAAAADWPQWRGPNRDGLSAEKGLLKEWPQDGPTRLWTAKGLGDGFASMAVADGLIYTAGNVGGDLMLAALDLAGQTKWQVKVGSAYTKDSPGSRGTPTVDGGCVYYETPDGTVSCLDAKSGKGAWSLNILKEFKGRNITWALSESVLIDGDHLIACPGGPEAAMVALDKKTGKTVWVCKGAGDKPGYASPIVVDYQGLRQYVTMTSHAAIGVHAKTGELLWRFGHKTSYDANIPTPIFSDGCVFIDSGYGSGGELLKLKVEGQKCSAEEVWRTKAIDNHHGGIILVDGCLYGSAHGGKWVCLDFKTGQVKYSTDGVGKGSITYADGLLYTYSERGNVGLVKATPEGHKVISRFRVPGGGKGPNWPHPVVCGGRLYLRHGDLLFAYDIKGK